jgi:hypothetical protein
LDKLRVYVYKKQRWFYKKKHRRYVSNGRKMAKNDDPSSLRYAAASNGDGKQMTGD